VPFAPALACRVQQRHNPGLVVWEFAGFFEGTDRWEATAREEGTLLVNRFAFSIPNPLVDLGFRLAAEGLTRRDMRAQLERIKALAAAL
jgi:hypothetical protein